MAKSTPHLSDLFNEGKLTTVVYPGKPEIDVWVARPDPGQMEKVIRRARVERARRYYELTNEDEEEHLALAQEVQNMDKPTLVEQLMDRERRELEQQAFNDLLFSKEIEDDEGKGTGKTEFGSHWGHEGQKWTDTLDAIVTRMEEIQLHNDELTAADITEGHIREADDPELERLSAVQVEFQDEVKVRSEELLAAQRQEIGLHSIGDLRAKLMEARIELECEATWFTHYKFNQLYHAVRYPDRKEKPYFQNANAIRALPKPVQDQLFDAYESLDLDGDKLKNLLTPLPS